MRLQNSANRIAGEKKRHNKDLKKIIHLGCNLAVVTMWNLTGFSVNIDGSKEREKTIVGLKSSKKIQSWQFSIKYLNKKKCKTLNFPWLKRIFGLS